LYLGATGMSQPQMGDRQGGETWVTDLPERPRALYGPIGPTDDLKE
jgi:hypothetical protein